MKHRTSHPESVVDDQRNATIMGDLFAKNTLCYVEG
jgi:hypothetical protein